MRPLLEDKRIRYLLIAVLVVVLVLGALNIISTAFSLLVPLAFIAIGGFAFYKIVLEGRDAAAVIEDEAAETAGVALDGRIAETADVDADAAEGARQRLSEVERARSEYIDAPTPAEEILDAIQTRKQRLTGEDDA